MCCIPEIMSRTEPIGTEPIGWVPFDPALFFNVQRQIGLDPFVMGNSIGGRAVYEPRAECLSCWANKADPEGKLRAEYAARKWQERQPDEIVVRL